MFKLILVIVSVVLISFSPTATLAEDDSLFSAHFYNSVVLGAAAGLIIGLAVGQGSITTFRITSLGLYGGIILGLTTGGTDHSDGEQVPSAALSPKIPTYILTFHY